MTTIIAGREVEIGDPWFDDGNIILVTHNEPTAFLLHRGVLSRHSDIFKDMFEVGQPADEDNDAASRQVVVMYDNPADLSSLVKALYDGVSSDPNDPNDFFQLAGVLRLATKYCAQRIRSQAIRFLIYTWSHTIQGHDLMTVTAMTTDAVDDLTYPFVHPLHVLNLARETDVEVLIPSATYFLSVYPLSEILAGDHPKLAIKHPSRPTSQLSPADLQSYTLMFQHRVHVGLDFIRRTCGKWTSPTPGCSNPECPKAFSRLVSRLQRSWNPRTAAIFFMLQVSHEAMATDRICPSCRKVFVTEVEALRSEVWDKLPSVVGLSSWEELVKRDLGSI
ncbi:hypothetical protein FA13DRAFT_1798571 [Coprinellus micaceus]|uniref:BTB domain-containing protein n=1 Tax=Coprinellus micaceus TaxID=71717 RepID=A0A4Y7SLS8_COPMI|nr:hypothetical protein FA13DRAFT_1798571 [Coprinellus micaceus]